MFLPGLDLYCAGPLALWRFPQLFLLDIGDYQKMLMLIGDYQKVTHLNWLAKIELGGPGTPGRQYYSQMLNESIVREKCQKKLKKHTVRFFATFL